MLIWKHRNLTQMILNHQPHSRIKKFTPKNLIKPYTKSMAEQVCKADAKMAEKGMVSQSRQKTEQMEVQKKVEK